MNVVAQPADPPSQITSDEFRARVGRLRSLMEARSIDVLIVYGDEKHYENVKYLTGYDPRFESALVLIGPKEEPAVITGAEGITLFEVTGRLGRAVPFLPFSVQGVTGAHASNLPQLLRDLGLRTGHHVGLVGQRYFTALEYPDDPGSHHFVPHMVYEGIVDVVGDSRLVRNETALLLHKSNGLRSRKSAPEVVLMEYASVVASRAVNAMLDSVEPGLTEQQLIAEALYAGRVATFAYQPIVLSGAFRCYSSLDSPSPRVMQRGEPVSMFYGPTVDGYCANTGRLGLLVAGPEELPASMKDVVPALYQPMYDAYIGLVRSMKIGARGGDLFAAATEPLAAAGLGTHYNAGHLIGLTEWEDTQVTPNSEIALASGHVLQADFTIFTSWQQYGPAKMEDGYAFADSALRAEIEAISPEATHRIESRRQVFAGAGIHLDASVLPLSDLAPTFRPFLLDRDYVLEPTP